MRMKAAIPTLSYLVERLNARHPDLVYIDVIASGAIFSQGPEDPSVRLHTNESSTSSADCPRASSESST